MIGQPSAGRSVRRYAETLEIVPSLRQRVVRHRHFPTLLLVIFVIALTCLHIWQRVMAIELANTVTALRTAQQEYTDQLKKASSEIAALSSPNRIESYAIDSLHMQPIAAHRLFTIELSSPDSVRSSTPVTQLYAAFERLADYLPTSTEAMAEPRDLVGVSFDSLGREIAPVRRQNGTGR